MTEHPPSTDIATLLARIDKLEIALKRGWNWQQFEYAEAHDEWAEKAGDGYDR